MLLFATAIAGRFYLSSDYHVKEIYPQLFAAFTYVTIGFFFWMSKFPECIPALGKYHSVQLYFNSHVFWHLLVFACEYNLYWGCFKASLDHE